MRVSPAHSLLAAAVEEVGDVGVLLGLGDMELADVVLGQDFRDGFVDILLAERDRAVEVVAVAGHRRQVVSAFEQEL